MRLDVGRPRAAGAGEALLGDLLRREPALLPGLSPNTVRRWRDLPSWMPPETQILCRHRARAGEHRIHLNSRRSPWGYELEFDLGVVHRFALPGALRLVAAPEGFRIDESEDGLPEGAEALGFVEQAPLPMLVPLEVRAIAATGQRVLVAGPDDPLAASSEPIGSLGWLDAFPIEPRHAALRGGSWGLHPLVRVADRDLWRHRYGTNAGGGVTLGSLWPAAQPGFVALRRRADGLLASDLLAASPARRTLLATARWTAAPLRWSGRPLAAAAIRARRALSVRVDGEEEATLGWLRAEPTPGWSPLFSALHPALGDQFVTRSELEALDLGYEVQGVLGFICDAGADRAAADQPPEVPWGSRFGRARRYVEGPVRR